MRDLFTALLPQLLPLLAGLLASVSFQWIKRASDIVDGLPAWLKQITVTVLAVALAWVGTTLGVELPTDLAAIDPTVWTGLVSAAMALAVHAIRKGASA